MSKLIKPATPSENTMDLIPGNAKNWEFIMMLILKDHHMDVMESEIAKYRILFNRNWKQPFAIAAN